MARTGGKQHFIRTVIDQHPELKDRTAKHALPVLNEEAKKQKMDFEITATDFGNYRNDLKKNADKEKPATIEAAVAAGRTEARKPAAPAPTAKKAAPTATAADPVAAAKAVKALVGQFGAETVKELADLFNK